MRTAASPHARPRRQPSAPAFTRRSLLIGPPAVLAAPLCAQARPTIGFVALAAREAAYFDAFTGGLVANGIQPGRAVTVVERYGNGQPELIRTAIRDLVSGGVRLFVAGGPTIARLITDLAPDAKIVVASLESLEVAGVPGTIARPAGNVTGFATFGWELIGKRIELLREIVPDLGHLVMAINPANRNHLPLVAAAGAAAARFKLTLSTASIRSIDDFDIGLAMAIRPGVNGAIFVRDFLFESHRERLVAAATAAKLPSSYDERAFVELGGLMSYAPNRTDLFRRSADYIARMIEGADPRDLPIQQPTRFDFVVSTRAARALGLTIPPAILLQADEVFE